MASFNIGFVLFPDLTQLDFTGPLQVLHRLPGSTTHIVAKTRDPVPSDCGLSLVPTATFADCPQLDLLCVPGGFGVSGAIADKATVDFVRRQGARAKYVTSVCTGAFVLGVAGLLKGRRATTHWAYTGLLPMVGATYEKARVVRDGNVFTGGGVTAGIDFALDGRRRGGGRRDGAENPALDRVRPGAALLRRPSRPRAGGRSRGPGGALRVAAADVPEGAARGDENRQMNLLPPTRHPGSRRTCGGCPGPGSRIARAARPG